MRRSKLPSEVLIYTQKMKRFFETDSQANKYFLSDIESDVFYKNLTEISLKNFMEKGDPSLDIEQFELLRKTVRAISIIKKPPEDFIWWDSGIMSKICLN